MISSLSPKDTINPHLSQLLSPSHGNTHAQGTSYSVNTAKSSPSSLNLRLVGEHSLWAHHLWNASRVLADYFDSHPELVKGKNILELGGGGALPSLVAACNGAKKVSLVLMLFSYRSRLLSRIILTLN